MKKMICVLLALTMIFALCACGKTAAPAEKKTFIMGIDPEYPPFSYLGDDGNYGGFDVEVCQAVCDYLGWELKIFGVNWDEKLVQLDSMECDCVWSGMTILDSMKDAGYVISAPYYDNTQVLVVKDGAGFSSSADLAGKVVAVQLGTSGEALLQGDLADLAASFSQVVTCNSFLTCFTELEGGAVDAVFVDISTRISAPSSTASPSAPATRSSARRSTRPCRRSSRTAPTPRSRTSRSTRRSSTISSSSATAEHSAFPRRHLTRRRIPHAPSGIMLFQSVQ